MPPAYTQRKTYKSRQHQRAVSEDQESWYWLYRKRMKPLLLFATKRKNILFFFFSEAITPFSIFYFLSYAKHRPYNGWFLLLEGVKAYRFKYWGYKRRSNCTPSLARQYYSNERPRHLRTHYHYGELSDTNNTLTPQLIIRPLWIFYKEDQRATQNQPCKRWYYRLGRITLYILVISFHFISFHKNSYYATQTSTSNPCYWDRSHISLRLHRHRRHHQYDKHRRSHRASRRQ